MVPLVFLQSNSGARVFETSAVSTCEDQPVARERFERRQPFKRSNIDWNSESWCPLEK
jgi:hypothetical protein